MATEIASNTDAAKIDVGAAREVAQHPFDIKTADVVFRTADGVDFYVYRIVLSLASPFFADMFSLKPPLPSDGSSAAVEPIVVPETSETFDSLVRICYPTDNPNFQNLPELECVLEAALKYQINVATKVTSRTARNFAEKLSIDVFAMACRLKLEEEAAWAADVFKRKKLHLTVANKDFTPSVSSLSAGEYYRLLQHCRSSFEPKITFLRHYDPRAGATTPAATENEVTPPSLPLSDANIILCSIEGDQFPTHTLLLRLASAETLLASQSPSDDQSSRLPVIQLGAISQTLKDFLSMCHPSGYYDVDDTRRLWNLSQFATHHSIPSIVAACRKQAVRLTPSRPLAIYLLAAHSGWQSEALAAARLLAKQKIADAYDPLMEDVSVTVYRSLLRFHKDSEDAILAVVNATAPGCDQWKANSGTATRLETMPILVSVPVVEQELATFTTVGSDVCRGCKKALPQSSADSHNPRSPWGMPVSPKLSLAKATGHTGCKYDVSALVASSQKLEQKMEDALLKVELR